MEFNATFIVSTISFIIFTLIMNKILYIPIKDIIEKREKYFAENKEEVKKNENEIENLIEQKDSKIREANKEAKDLILTETDRLKDQKNQDIKKAKQDIANRVNISKEQLEEEKNTLHQEISNDVDELSDRIVSKILEIERNKEEGIDYKKNDEVIKNV